MRQKTRTQKQEKQKDNKDNTVDICLDGRIFVQERDKKGKVISESDIDGKVVLELILAALRKYLDENVQK